MMVGQGRHLGVVISLTGRRRVFTVTAGLALIGRWVACLPCLGLVASPFSLAGTKATATVPVVVCPTSVGAASSPRPVPSSAKVPATGAHLVVYSTTSGYLQVLAPKGFFCNGSIGADGGASLTASAPSPFYNPSSLGNGGVSTEAVPTCVGSQLLLACPFFPVALVALHREYPGTSCDPQPLGQHVKRLSADVVAIYDPAGEAVPSSSGGLVPNNSPYATDGVVVYAKYRYQGYTDTTAMEAVCVLPTDEHATCSTVLDVFLQTQVAKFT